MANRMVYICDGCGTESKTSLFVLGFTLYPAYMQTAIEAHTRHEFCTVRCAQDWLGRVVDEYEFLSPPNTLPEEHSSVWARLFRSKEKANA